MHISYTSTQSHYAPSSVITVHCAHCTFKSTCSLGLGFTQSHTTTPETTPSPPHPGFTSPSWTESLPTYEDADKTHIHTDVPRFQQPEHPYRFQINVSKRHQEYQSSQNINERILHEYKFKLYLRMAYDISINNVNQLQK